MPFHSQKPLWPGSRGLIQIEIDVIGDKEVELAVAVVIDKGAAGAVADTRHGKMGLGGDVFKGAVAPIAIKDVVAVVGDQQVGVAVIVVIADTDPLAPAFLF